MTKKFILTTILFLIFAQGVSALTANSSNYSVSMFGTGLATGNLSSANYNKSIVLSEAQGTTRNAESSLYTANIGFFENTIYYRTVSITSYSISPKSAVIGSTIGFSISALNSQTLWAKITSPNAQEQTLNLINNQAVSYLPSPAVVGRYNVTFYANSSTGAIASAIDYFELTEQTTIPPPTGGGGGGGATTIIEKCTYTWDCTPWGICSEGKQKRECKNIGTCNGTENKPIEETKCSEALFDVGAKLNNIKLDEDNLLNFNIDLIEKMGVEKIDVLIKYSVINKEEYEIFSQTETKSIQGNLSYQKEIQEIRLTDGEYTLRVDILYGNLQRASAELKFRLINGRIEIITKDKSSVFDAIKNALSKANAFILIAILAALAILVALFCILIHFFKKSKESGSRKQTKRLLLAGIILDLAVLFIVFTRLNATGKVIESTGIKKGYWAGLFVILFLIIVFVVSKKYISRRKDIIPLTKALDNLDKPSAFIKEKKASELAGKEVYTGSGIYLGKIRDIILAGDKIDSLKIEIDRKYKFKARGVIINYGYIKDIGEVVITDEKVHKILCGQGWREI